MREIWCRGRRLDNGEWVEGYFWKEFDERCFIGADVGTEWDCQKYRTIVEVIPETIGQYIGLKDKNGKEICEGDIVREQGTDYTPIYQNGIYMAYNVDKINDAYVSTQFNVIWRNGCEIIGNIHENQELIER